MQDKAVNSIKKLFIRNRLVASLGRLIDAALMAAFAVLTVSLFFKINYIVWMFLALFVATRFVYVIISSAMSVIGEKQCYRELDSALDLKQRAVTYYEIKTGLIKPEGAASKIAAEDFLKILNEKSYIFEDASLFNSVFKKTKFGFTRPQGYVALACAVILAFNAYDIYVNKDSGKKNAGADFSETKEVKKDAAKIIDAMIEENEKKISAADAITELKSLGEKLKNPVTDRQFAKQLSEAADKLKSLQQGENRKEALAEMKKIESEANGLIAGKTGEGFTPDDKKAAAEKMENFKKMVEDYLKSSNDKDFKKIEAELNSLVSLLEEKKDAIKKSAGQKKDGVNSKESGGVPGQTSAEEKSAAKHRSRMSGKEFLDKLKNDKQLQQMYAALKAMSDEAEENGKEGSAASGQGDPKGKESKNGGNGSGGEGKISAESMGISIPKPGKGSTNLKQGSSDAPLMAPQERQKAGEMSKKQGQWKAFFEAQRFSVNAQKTKVDGVHDMKAPSIMVEGRSLPDPGEAKGAISELVKGESAAADSFVSSDRVADELKKNVGDYFKKLNNDYENK